MGQSLWFHLSFLYSFLKFMWKLINSECLPILKMKIDVETDFWSELLSLSPGLKEHLTIPHSAQASLAQGFLPFEGLPSLLPFTCLYCRRLSESGTAASRLTSLLWLAEGHCPAPLVAECGVGGTRRSGEIPELQEESDLMLKLARKRTAQPLTTPSDSHFMVPTSLPCLRLL